MGFDINGITLSSAAGTTLAMNSGATNWMAVNANGILSRPQTPYMWGTTSGQAAIYNAGGGNLLVIANENIGSCWNNSTGVWTCPVAGYYMVAMGNIATGALQTNSYGYIGVFKNGVLYGHNHWNFGGNWHYLSLSSIVAAAAGDTIVWQLFSYVNAGIHGAGGHGSFSIALMA